MNRSARFPDRDAACSIRPAAVRLARATAWRRTTWVSVAITSNETGLNRYVRRERRPLEEYGLAYCEASASSDGAVDANLVVP